MLELLASSLDSVLPAAVLQQHPRIVWIAWIVILSIVYLITRAIYLLYLHPLAAFPGPRRAALSSWWVYGITKTGRIEQNLELLHKKYNTHALRIGPNELHLTDPQLYHTIYSQKYVYPKDSSFYDGFNTPHSVFVESDRELHRQRRKKMNAFFSKASMRDLQGIMIEKIALLCDRISGEKNNAPIHMYQAIRCLTVDVISELAFGSSFNTLQDATDTAFSADFLDAFDRVAHSIWALISIPIFRTIIQICPPAISARLSRTARHVQRLLGAANNTVVRFRSNQASGKKSNHEVMFEEMTGLTDAEMQAEAMDVLVAGSDTTATTLATALEEMSRTPSIFEKLKQELSEAGIKTEEDYDLVKLEQLPYLSAVVKESLRYALAVPGRLPRIVPPGIEPLMSDGKLIPVGTTIGMSAYSMHFNEDLWGPDARRFVPERWLTGEAKHLDKYMVTFSKGARQCLGINMTQAELVLALAMLVNRFSFTLDETMADEDITQLDYFTVGYKGSGVRMYVHEAK
ncbi:cytochrome P450 [Plenodomus tracheiphilus IPT5]|uniref:Cytochrome P450 n=1 Tax=Plenodomus tracheiphilus IPT5 TaxID=1408161 RepID=A0A6A7BBM6_9PLEO|nr:cytochrome P450 [Plenodomus tracheiphilus IPT5]